MRKVEEMKIVYSINCDQDYLLKSNIKPHSNSLTWGMDLYQKEKDSDICVMLIPGGPVKSSKSLKDWGFMQSWANLLCSKGISAAAIHHDFCSRANLELSQNNICDAFTTLKSLLSNRSKIVIFSFSGGGQLLDKLFSERVNEIHGAVFYYALISNFLLSDKSKDFPTFIAKAGLDRKNINLSLDKYSSKLNKNGTKCELMIHPEGKHGFDIVNDDDVSKDIIKKTIKFISSI